MMFKVLFYVQCACAPSDKVKWLLPTFCDDATLICPVLLSVDPECSQTHSRGILGDKKGQFARSRHECTK